jgi:proteasome lid subunit RPN8/RPN11
MKKTDSGWNISKLFSSLAERFKVNLRHEYPNMEKNRKPNEKRIRTEDGIKLVVTEDVMKRIKSHVFTKPEIECGGYLIGRLQCSDDKQNVIGYVEDIYHDDSVGSTAQFVFTAQYGLKAYSYCSKTYKNEDGVSLKKIIGNYHSHGNFNAFFSNTDRVMIFAGTAQEFYLVFSPGRKEMTALFKDKQQKLFAVDITQNVDFRYCEPTIPQISIDYSMKGIK